MICLSLHFWDGHGPFDVDTSRVADSHAVTITEKPLVHELEGSPSPWQTWRSVGLFFQTAEAATLVGDALKRALGIDLAAPVPITCAAIAGAGNPFESGPASTEAKDVLP